MPPWQQPDVIHLSRQLAVSFQHWTGKSLLTSPPERLSLELYHAPFVVVAHDVEHEPVFCYANLAAQKLWNMSWKIFTALPSRLSAEPMAQEERQKLLARAASHGFVDDYHGVRVTADGRRFRIRQCTLWNIVDERLAKKGQAATFSHWEWL